MLKKFTYTSRANGARQAKRVRCCISNIVLQIVNACINVDIEHIEEKLG